MSRAPEDGRAPALPTTTGKAPAICGAVLEDDGGYAYTCQERPHDGRNRRRALKHRAGAWFAVGNDRRVPVEIKWGDPEDTA